MPVASFFDSGKSFRVWLQANAATAAELTVGFHKLSTGQASMTWSESVDEALCFGWIDGVRRRIDDSAYSIRFTPRKPGSIWSAVNIAKVEQLCAQGRMTSAGEIAFSKRSPQKSAIYAYEQGAMAELSPEELHLFQRSPAAWAYFEACPPGYQKVVLHWVTTAKLATTRSSRFTKLVQACSAGLRLR